MTNRERLEQAKIIPPGAETADDELEAIESLTTEEIDALISITEKFRERLKNRFIPGPVTHHIPK